MRMRRQDREIVDETRIEAIIAACSCCRIGFYDDGQIYIVPLNFGYAREDGRYTLYFHSAKAGRKIDLIEKCPKVGFEMDANYSLKTGDTACSCSARFQSVIGSGTVRFVSGESEKLHALKLIMAHNTGRGDWAFDQGMLQNVCVFRLEVESLSCKEHE